MMLMLMERAKPAGFDLGNADEVAWHCRRAVASIAASGGEVHWLTTYATEDGRLLGVLAIESRAALDAYLARAGVEGEVKLSRIVCRLDPSMAGTATQRRHDSQTRHSAKPPPARGIARGHEID